MAEDIRVLIVDLSKKYGGSSVRALTLADHLKPWKVAIAGLEDGQVVAVARERNIPTRIVGRTRTDPMIPWRLKTVIREDGFQVIDTQNIPSKFWAALSSYLTDVAFVSTLNSSYEDEFGTAFRGKFYSWLDRWTNTKVNRYVAVSKAIHTNLTKARIPEAKIDLITNGVTVDRSFSTTEQKLTRQKIDVPADAILCVCVGRLVWAKGYEDFIESFSLVAKRMPNAYAAIVGGGGLYDDLSERIAKAGLQKRVKLLGQCDVNTTWNIMKASDIFALTSRSEGVPYALLEAAAFGLPILATRCGGIPEVLSDNVDALLVPVGDTIAISTGLIRLCEDKQLAQRLAANAYAKIERDYSLSAQITAMRLAYRKALESKNARLRDDFSVAVR
jgi:glycosyltransferase involved in cell wall biosynthesis